MSNKLIKFKRHMNKLAVKITQLQDELCVAYDNEELRLDLDDLEEELRESMRW